MIYSFLQSIQHSGKFRSSDRNEQNTCLVYASLPEFSNTKMGLQLCFPSVLVHKKLATKIAALCVEHTREMVEKGYFGAVDLGVYSFALRLPYCYK